MSPYHHDPHEGMGIFLWAFLGILAFIIASIWLIGSLKSAIVAALAIVLAIVTARRFLPLRNRNKEHLP